jgi:hypothetical protein
MSPSILSLISDISFNFTNSNGNLFQIQDQNYLYLTKFENNIFQIYLQKVDSNISSSPILIYTSSDNIKISKLFYDSLSQSIWFCGVKISTTECIYGYSKRINENLSPMEVFSFPKTKKIEDILLLDLENILLIGISKDDDLWVIHHQNRTVNQINLENNNQSFVLKKTELKEDEDILNLYIESINSSGYKNIKIYQISISEVISNLIY